MLLFLTTAKQRMSNTARCTMARRLNLAPQLPRRRENLDMTGHSSPYTIKFSPLDKEALHSELTKTPINLFRNFQEAYRIQVRSLFLRMIKKQIPLLLTKMVTLSKTQELKCWHTCQIPGVANDGDGIELVSSFMVTANVKLARKEIFLQSWGCQSLQLWGFRCTGFS